MAGNIKYLFRFNRQLVLKLGK